MDKAKHLINQLQSFMQYEYSMQWLGMKVPCGATIGGITIVCTQHGLITGVKGERLGYYRRTKEFGGPNQDEHAIVISTMEVVEILSPDGSVCDPNRSDKVGD